MNVMLLFVVALVLLFVAFALAVAWLDEARAQAQVERRLARKYQR